MKESNMQLLLALAAAVIIYLLMRPACAPPVGTATATTTTGATAPGVTTTTVENSLTALKNAIGVQGKMRRMVPREDNQRQTTLVGIGEKCPPGYSMAPNGFNLSNGGCHVTCGGNGPCGAGPDGLDDNGVPVPQRCCQEDI
tara:strand:+ start:14748 stop:15173 length:426 start_codon:yes stop_codon:yes gene_type:complete